MASRSKGFGYYVRKALVEKWNLGFFFAALGFSALSPAPDALLPIVLGLEGLFLLGMGGHPKFRQSVDAQDHKADTAASSEDSSRTFQQMMDRLDSTDRARFRQLVLHCQQMQSLASGVQSAAPVDDLRTSALNRLLFFYLRLLVTRNSLRTFLEQSDVDDLRARRTRVQTQLAAAEAAQEERLKSSLADTLADLDARITNVEKSQKDAQYLDIELQRIEGKAQALAEAAITRQDPTEVAAQVTAFTDTLKLSEEMESHMVSLQGLELASDAAPAILQQGKVRTNA